MTSSDAHGPPASTPRPAATIMLLREADGGIEVLMTRRHANLAFMGGLWVFPGGARDTADTSDAAIARLGDLEAVKCARLSDPHGQPLTQRECLGFAIAACRETFEETGVLLAIRSDGSPCPAGLIAQLQAERTRVCKEPRRFIELLAAADLTLDVRRLGYWAHWITPSNVPRRFDTHFFAVAAPAAQPVSVDPREASECLWRTPTALIAAARAGSMQLSQPTLFNVLDLQISLAACGTLQDFFERESTRPVTPVMPKMLLTAAGRTMVLPWDEEYRVLPGETAAAHFTYGEATRGLPSRMTTAPSRDVSSPSG